MPVGKERLLIACGSRTSAKRTASQTNCYHYDLTRFAQSEPPLVTFPFFSPTADQRTLGSSQHQVFLPRCSSH